MLEARAHSLTHTSIPGYLRLAHARLRSYFWGLAARDCCLGRSGLLFPLSLCHRSGTALPPRPSASLLLFGLELIQVEDRSARGKPRNR